MGSRPRSRRAHWPLAVGVSSLLVSVLAVFFNLGLVALSVPLAGLGVLLARSGDRVAARRPPENAALRLSVVALIGSGLCLFLLLVVFWRVHRDPIPLFEHPWR